MGMVKGVCGWRCECVVRGVGVVGGGCGCGWRYVSVVGH